MEEAMWDKNAEDPSWGDTRQKKRWQNMEQR